MFSTKCSAIPLTRPTLGLSKTVCRRPRHTVLVVGQHTDDVQRKGKVWLVGAGPGPPDLLTLRAARILEKADVVVYDDLISEVTAELAPQAEHIYVGKRGGRSSVKQVDIDRLLVELCSQGRQVVRLKGGCCSVFSRVHSELNALNQAGLQVEMVPGISSALAGPLFAGISLTDKELSRHFVVTSCHDPDNLDWTAFAGIDTLVLLMGARKLSDIVHRLQDQSGRQHDTPVMIIQSAGTANEKVWEGTLSGIVEDTRQEALSPCIIVVGDVVKRRTKVG